MRNVGLALATPVAHRLHGQLSRSRELPGATVERREDFGYGVHVLTLSEKRIVAQAVSYPTLAEARIIALGQNADVTVDADVEAIRAEAEKQGFNQTQLAKVAGLPSQSAMSNIFKGKRELKRREADLLFDFLGIERSPAFQAIPLIGLASAGAWNEAVVMPTRTMPIPRGIAGKDAFAVEIKGDSMNKLLPEGGWAVVDPDQRHLYAGRVYLIENDDRETTVKRYCGDPARFEPVSDNELHKPLVLADVRYRVIGRVVSYGNTVGL